MASATRAAASVFMASAIFAAASVVATSARVARQRSTRLSAPQHGQLDRLPLRFEDRVADRETARHGRAARLERADAHAAWPAADRDRNPSRRSTVCASMPRWARRTCPCATNSPTTRRAVLLEMAKHRPCAPPIIAVLMPTTSPDPATSGPPELPGFKAASVWITSSMSRPPRARSERPSAETTPAVTVDSKPSGSPMATRGGRAGAPSNRRAARPPSRAAAARAEAPSRCRDHRR